jgi:hypothetical protein
MLKARRIFGGIDIMSEDYRDQITDEFGRILENLCAMIIEKSEEFRKFGVSHGLEVGGNTYRYSFIVAKEGTEEFEQIEEADPR